MAVRDGAIDFDHVSFVYASKADKKVLDDIDLHIRSGETIGVIGGTGASKSSLVQLIPRLYDVTAGKLTLGGVDVRDYDLETLRNAVAMVLQKTSCFPARSRRTSAGAMRMPRTRNSSTPACSRVRMSSSPPCRTAMTPISSRAAQMSPAARSSACASPARCSKAEGAYPR